MNEDFTAPEVLLLGRNEIEDLLSMDEAIEAVLEGKKPKHEFLYSIGCSIKWKK